MISNGVIDNGGRSSKNVYIMSSTIFGPITFNISFNLGTFNHIVRLRH